MIDVCSGNLSLSYGKLSMSDVKLLIDWCSGWDYLLYLLYNFIDYEIIIIIIISFFISLVFSPWFFTP